MGASRAFYPEPAPAYGAKQRSSLCSQLSRLLAGQSGCAAGFAVGTATSRTVVGFEGAGFRTHACECSPASSSVCCKHLVELFPSDFGRSRSIEDHCCSVKTFYLANE